MSRKVIIPAPGAWPAFDTSLGICQNLLDKGYNVEFINCDGKKEFCPANPYLSTMMIGKFTCELCKYESTVKLNALKNKERLKIHTLSSFEDGQRVISNNLITEDVQNMSYSTLQSTFWATSVELSKVSIKKFFDIIIQNLQSFRAADKLLSSFRSGDVLIIFNGRISGFYPFVSAAKKNQIDYYCYEHPDSGAGAFVVKNAVVHDPNEFGAQLFEYFKVSNCDNGLCSVYAKQWIGSRRLGRSKDKNASFGKRNTLESLQFEPNLKKYKRVYTFFTSTEFEVEFMKDVIYFGYKSQIDFVKDFIEKFLSDDEALIIRMHPNMKNADTSFRDEFYKIVNQYNKSNIFLIRSEELVSSYKCIDLSDIIIGFGSTITLEAALCGKPVISLCNRPWKDFSFDYQLAHINELPALVDAIDINFDQDLAMQRASQYLYSFHKFLSDNPLVSDLSSKFFHNKKSNLWFRFINFLYDKTK